MSAISPCIPCCSTPQVVNVPGGAGGNGTNGTNGTNGHNALSITSAGFVVPAVGSTVTVSVDSSLWMVVGQIVIATGPANFQVTALPDATSATLRFLGYPGDVAPASNIALGSTISPAGMRGGSTVYYTSTPVSIAATAYMDMIEVTATLQTVTLPTAVGIAGKIYTIKLTSAGSGTVATTGGQTIDGAASFSLSAQYKYIRVISNGANWLNIGSN